MKKYTNTSVLTTKLTNTIQFNTGISPCKQIADAIGEDMTHALIETDSLEESDLLASDNFIPADECLAYATVILTP